MNIADTTAPKSEQQNFDDYMTGPKTVTVSKVEVVDADQPVHVHLEEFPGRPYKPSKSMRRVLIAAWGPEGSVYAGRRMTLYGDPAVRFGADVVGGVKISHLSHIDKAVKVNLTVSKGRRALFTVQPLPDAPPPRDWTAEIGAAKTESVLRALWGESDQTEAISAMVKARRAELEA